ncbi:hypothetical protein [Actinoallomurus sp. NPDC050550]|uniref:hypothetical protein n=1 Tax=Actinoallomurus sp. NPDC050550 TaxID=3154937 RepID=UPI0033CD9A17
MKIKARFGALLTVTSLLAGLSRPPLGGHRTEGAIEIMKLAKAALAGLLAVPTVVGI